MNRVEQAVAHFSNGYNCAQSIVAVYAPLYGINEREAERISGGFGAGLGGLRLTCGAFTGLVMILGLARGYDKADVKDKAAFYAAIRSLGQEFTLRAGSLDCATLLKNAAISIQSEPSPRTGEYYKSRPCERYVRAAAEILEERVVKL